jgi:hypothetical protein
LRELRFPDTKMFTKDGKNTDEMVAGRFPGQFDPALHP